MVFGIFQIYIWRAGLATGVAVAKSFIPSDGNPSGKNTFDYVVDLWKKTNKD